MLGANLLDCFLPSLGAICQQICGLNAPQIEKAAARCSTAIVKDFRISFCVIKESGCKVGCGAATLLFTWCQSA